MNFAAIRNSLRRRRSIWSFASKPRLTDRLWSDVISDAVVQDRSWHTDQFNALQTRSQSLKTSSPSDQVVKVEIDGQSQFPARASNRSQR